MTDEEIVMAHGYSRPEARFILEGMSKVGLGIGAFRKLYAAGALREPGELDVPSEYEDFPEPLVEYLRRQADAVLLNEHLRERISQAADEIEKRDKRIAMLEERIHYELRARMRLTERLQQLDPPQELHGT